MVQWLISKFRKHKYLPTRMSSTGGQNYVCTSCGNKIYIPLEWSYQFSKNDIKNLKGCKKTK